MLYYCYACADISQGIPGQIVNVDRRVRVCPAALSDLRMLLPRRASRVIALRHAKKLERWQRGSGYALDLEVVGIPGSVIRELCIADCFGFHCGMRLAFFENTLAEPDGRLWVIGLRREDEMLSQQIMDMLNHRMEIIEELN
jgi:hypothetical protein